MNDPRRYAENMYQEIISSLESAGHTLTWFGATNEDAISSISSAIDCPLPVSFITFLVEFGGGGLLEYLYISNAEYPEESAGSVLADTSYYRSHFDLPNHLVVIQRDYDDNPPHCLDTSLMQDGECPVVSFCPGSCRITRIAEDFSDYYRRFTEPFTNQLA